jgi:tetratricopeptide (TPR) repeat protein
MEVAKATALLRASRLASRRNDLVLMHSTAVESREIFTQVGEKEGMGEALIQCFLSGPRTTPEIERTQLAEIATFAEEAADNRSLAQALYYLGDLALVTGEVVEARSYYSQSLEIARRGGYKPSVALTLVKLAGISRALRDYESARSQYEESLEIYREMRDRWASMYALGNIGALAYEEGDVVRAEAVFEETLALAREFGALIIMAPMLGNLGALHCRRGNYALAQTMAEEALAISRNIGQQAVISMQLYLLGRIAQYQGDYRQAMKYFSESMAISAQEISTWGENSSGHEVAACLTGVASLRLAQGHVKRSALLLGAAHALRQRIARLIVMEAAVQNALAEAEQEETSAAARTRLGEEAWQVAWEEGQAMSIYQAIAYALEDEPAQG